MRNFLKLADAVDYMPLLLAMQRQPGLWNQYNVRTTYPGTPHDVDDILLRFQEITENLQDVADQHESIWYPAVDKLPQARPIIFALMNRVEGERLGRVMLTRLSPGHSIKPHSDGGDHAAYYERFHISLQCPEQALFRAGEEVVHMPPGSVWWFNNAVEHEVWNESTQDRIVMIVDIRTAR
jgi:hypothetical protein